jgi:hypothetical protein
MSIKGISPQNYPGGDNAMYHRIIGLRVELLCQIVNRAGVPSHQKREGL